MTELNDLLKYLQENKGVKTTEELQHFFSDLEKSLIRQMLKELKEHYPKNIGMYYADDTQNWFYTD